MHATFRLAITFSAIAAAFSVAPVVRAQQQSTAALPPPSVMLEGPPVVFDQPGLSVVDSPETPLLAPKVQKEVDKGKAALIADKLENAQSLFQKAYEAAPGNPQVNFLLGVTFMAMNNLNQADTYLSRSYSIYPQDPATLIAVGILRVKQSKFESAISALKAAIGLNHQLYLAHLILARAFLAENKFADSLTEAREALKQGKRDAAEAKFFVGASLANLGRKEEALTSLQQFVKESPDDPAVKDAKELMTVLTTQLDHVSSNRVR